MKTKNIDISKLKDFLNKSENFIHFKKNDAFASILVKLHLEGSEEGKQICELVNFGFQNPLGVDELFYQKLEEVFDEYGS